MNYDVNNHPFQEFILHTSCIFFKIVAYFLKILALFLGESAVFGRKILTDIGY